MNTLSLDFTSRQWKALFAIPLVAMLLACQPSTVASYVQIIGNAGASLAAILNNPTLSAKLKTDTATAVAQINAFVPGTTCQNIEASAQILMTDYQDIIALFGAAVPANVQALVDLAVTTLLALLPLLPGCKAPAMFHAKAGVPPAKDAKEFKKRWNLIVDNDPKLAKAHI